MSVMPRATPRRTDQRFASLHTLPQLHKRLVEGVDLDEYQSRKLNVENDIKGNRHDDRNAQDVQPPTRLASLPITHMDDSRTGLEVHIHLGQGGDLSNPQPSLEHELDERDVARRQPMGGGRCGMHEREHLTCLKAGGCCAPDLRMKRR
jgi:hypothetical protein